MDVVYLRALRTSNKNGKVGGGERDDCRREQAKKIT
jgi:hypothetical protein